MTMPMDSITKMTPRPWCMISDIHGGTGRMGGTTHHRYFFAIKFTLITLCDQVDHKMWSFWSQIVIKLITLCDQNDHTLWSKFVIKICDEFVILSRDLNSGTHDFIVLSRDWSNIITRDGLVPFRGFSWSKLNPYSARDIKEYYSLRTYANRKT